MKGITEQLKWFALMLVLFVPLTVISGSATPEPKFNPDTGHYYDVVLGSFTWDQARVDAQQRSFAGWPGHLVTITSDAENNFISTNVNPPHGSWAGGLQAPGATDPSSNWQWITGEPFVYTAWYPYTSEPNDLDWVEDGTEDVLQLYALPYAGPIISWNDNVRETIVSIADYSYVIEYEPPLISQRACYIDAPAAVYEGASFSVTVRCEGINDVYGFQLGTSARGAASPSAASYTPGSFVTDVGSEYLEGSNTLSDYSIARRAPANASSGSFSLGSLSFTASTGLTANSSATLSLDTLLLGDISGASISVPITNTTIVTILDLSTFNLTVASDGSVQQVRDVTASVDSENRGPQTGPGTSLTLGFTDVINSPTPMVTADMKSHLVCSGVLDLATSITNQTIHLKAGDVVLNSADASPRINIFDATTIRLAFGSAGSGEEDVNGDGTINVFDMIHVGRNYGAVTGACS